MNNALIQYYEACKKLENHLLNEDLAGVMAWKEDHHWTFKNEEQGCNPIQLFGSMIHKFELDKINRDKLSIMAGMMFILLEGEQIEPLIRAKMICDFASRIYPDVMKPFFDEGGMLHVSPQTLNEEDARLEGAYLRAEPLGSHMDGVAYALDKLGGWYAFDEAIMNRVIISRRPDYMATVVTHPKFQDAMAEKRFVINRDVLVHPDVLAFAFNHNKVDVSNLGVGLRLIIERDDSALLDKAIEVSIDRTQRYKDGNPVDNFRSLELYLKVHAPESPLREKALSAFTRARNALNQAEMAP